MILSIVLIFSLLSLEINQMAAYNNEYADVL